MDIFWYRNPSKSEVIDRGWKNRMTMQNRQMSNDKKRFVCLSTFVLLWVDGNCYDGQVIIM